MSAALDQLAAVLERMTPDQAAAYLAERDPATWPAELVEVYERMTSNRFEAGWRVDPMAMALHLDPGEVRDWPYARLMARQVRKAVTGESRFQVWNVPTQMGKSTWMQRGLVWALDAAPGKTYQYLTYGDTLAQEASDFVRSKARMHQSKLGFDLRADRQNLHRWKTEQGGGVLFSSLGGAVSGFSATGGVMIDDPIKNWEEAHSKRTRDNRWNEIRAVAFKRLAEGAFLILAHARMHQDDPSGRMHELAAELGVEVEFVVMPMLSKGPMVDILGRPEGQPLEPEKYSAKECAIRIALDGAYMNAALDSQDPQPEQGGEFLREWWAWTDTPPSKYSELLVSWDMKLKDKEAGDYVVGLAVGRIGGRAWIVDMCRGQFSQLQTKVAIAWMGLKHPDARRQIVENTGNGPEVMTELRAGDPSFVLTVEVADKVGVPEDQRDAVQAIIRLGLSNLVANNPKGSKAVRARREGAKIEAGSVTLPKGNRWAHAVVDEWAAFPPKTGGHDDIVDATTQALDKLFNSKASILNDPDTTSSGPVTGPRPDARAAPTTPKRRATVLR